MVSPEHLPSLHDCIKGGVSTVYAQWNDCMDSLHADTVCMPRHTYMGLGVGLRASGGWGEGGGCE